jgi:hypothetical protein
MSEFRIIIVNETANWILFIAVRYLGPLLISILQPKSGNLGHLVQCHGLLLL